MLSERKLRDAGGDDAPNFNDLTFFRKDVREGRIFRLELNAASSLVQALHSEIAIDDRHDDMVVARFDGTVNDHDVVIENARFDHRVTAGAQKVGRLRMNDQHLCQVNALRPQVVSGRRKASADPVDDQPRQQRRVSDEHRDSGGEDTVHPSSIGRGYHLAMCSHYQAIKERAKFEKQFNVKLPPYTGVYDVWPTYEALFIRRPREADVGDEAVPEREALAGEFGLLPHWAKDKKFGRRTYNARSETAATLPSFRDAWRKRHRCIIPAEAIYEPDWRSGRAVPTRITRSDGEPMGIAGLWSWWKSSQGQEVHSFTMLTVNADEHSLMRNYHKPNDEKRMVVILPQGAYEDWLTAPADRGMDFMRAYPADRLVASGQETSSLW